MVGRSFPRSDKLRRELEDLVRRDRLRFRARVLFVLAIVALLVAAMLASGCSVTKAEYRAVVEDSQAYFDAVAPVFSAYTLADPHLSEQSKRDRLALNVEHARSLEKARAR